MKNILTQYLYIFVFAFIILTLAYTTYPKKQNQLEFLEKRIDDIQEQREILTEKEKELERLATEKEWEEVDSQTDK
tara:strand:+ start:433 stop:660 length:228 start_codon:yes stop_codon:yes gene_type:complete